MTCPTCDHTMESIGLTEWGLHSFWCPRCGTMRHCSSVVPESFDDEVPQLVARCQAFRDEGLDPESFPIWHRLGIEETIHTAQRRRKP